MSSTLQLIGVGVIGLIAAWILFQLVVGIIGTVISLFVTLLVIAAVAGLAYVAISALI